MKIPVASRAIVPIVAVTCLLLSSDPASAQYFGQNKVQFTRFAFQVLRTEHFDVYFYPEERAGVDIAARLAERWHARLERFFGHTLRGRQPLVLYASHADFEQNNVIGGAIGEGTGGVTESVRRRIVLPLDGSLGDIDHVIGHELVHAFQFDITAGPDAPGGAFGANRLPLWFIEGMAEYLSLGPADATTAMWLRDAAREEKLPAIDDLDNPRYFPYRWGHAFWAYVGGRWGDEVIPQVLVAAARSGDVDDAIGRVLGLKAKELSAEWQRALRETYRPALASATPPAGLGRVVVKAAGLGGELNVGPAISPDGRLVAFLSTRSVFSVDLYVADAATGRILRKLTDTAADPHYSSLQFIYSAGAWDQASRRLAVATVSRGRPALAIFDVERGVREREVRVPDVDGMLHPTWAPDGRGIAFTGTRGGLTDLYVYDLATSSVRRLTADPYTDLQAAWSPDGARLAFTTDRFATDIETLTRGPLGLATLDLASGRIEPVRSVAGGKQINPQWSPDGGSLYFVSDRDGASNVYRVRLATGEVAQVTQVATGISGITGSSPAMSVSQATGVVALSVYDRGQYAIHVLEGNLPGTRPGAASATAAMLPPADRPSSLVGQLLADMATGLPPATADQPVAPYRPRLSLEQVGQPVIALGASRFGAAIGGGLSLSFGDMLGNHRLQTAVQLHSLTGNASVRDLAAEGAYVNRARRWNWGLVGGQIPYLSGGFESGLARVGGRLVGIDRLIVNRQTERSASGLVAYPFDRARRIEFQGGLTEVSFDQTVQTTVYDPFTGGVLSVDTTTSPLARPLTLATSSAAFVTDTSNFGATSPVSGSRARLEIGPTFGTIAYTGVLGDYRRYFMPAPFYTFAVRGLHYGRYGSGGEDARLFPLYLGFPSLVRGYDVNSFDARDCVPDAASTCPAFDRLMGSRMLVGNVEFRFPLLRPFGASRGMYGPLPVEVAFFADGGVAWTRGDAPAFLGGSRTGVSSAGVALRVSLFGFAVGELDLVRPFQRVNRGWLIQFNLLPGF